MQFPSFSGVAQKAIFLVLNFSDDLAFFLLTRLGFNWPWLREVGTLFLTITIAYWVVRLIYRYSQKQML